MDRWGQREVALVVHTEASVRHRLKALLRSASRQVVLARSAREALTASQHVEADILLVGLPLGDLRGARAVDAFRDALPGVPLIALARTPDVSQAVDALRAGASDYLPEEAGEQAILEAMERALLTDRTRREVAQARSDVQDQYGISQLLTQSPRMLDVFDKIRAVAATPATALILGETGTGKELVSRAIHAKSARRDQPFVSVNCGAFTETLLESELFGHEKGSFTGADSRRVGVFEMADGGTLFLDELGDTSLAVQVKLLRVLETMAFRRVGGREEVHVDVRIVAATNAQLPEAVEAERFREDLYYRLNVFPIRLPPLRERREDIPLLMRHFLDEISQGYEREPPVLSGEALDRILSYHWPGNVRQLRAYCERWVITHGGQRLEREHLPPSMSGSGPSDGLDGPGSFVIDENRPLKANTDRVLSQVERAYLFRALRKAEGVVGRAAEIAGISRRTLYTKMKRYGLDAEDFRRS